MEMKSKKGSNNKGSKFKIDLIVWKYDFLLDVLTVGIGLK